MLFIEKNPHENYHVDISIYRLQTEVMNRVVMEKSWNFRKSHGILMTKIEKGQ